MNGEWIDIVAQSPEQAERLAGALRADFAVEVVANDEHLVRVTPDSETTRKLVAVFHAIGRWLAESRTSACDVRFGDGRLTVMAASADDPGDPTSFLIERTRQLEQALESRIAIEQAKGILAERHAIGVDEAFERLRREARSARRNIHEVAGDIVPRRDERPTDD